MCISRAGCERLQQTKQLIRGPTFASWTTSVIGLAILAESEGRAIQVSELGGVEKLAKEGEEVEVEPT